MFEEDFYKMIYVVMISLGLKRLEIDKDLVLKSTAPAMYITLDTKTNKYIFNCLEVNDKTVYNIPEQNE